MTAHVLIVDDAEPCATTLEIAFLEMADVRLSVVSNGREALRVLRAGGVSALVTDLNLPGISGFELIEQARRLAGPSRLPVIVVSGEADPTTPERLLRLGVDAYFPKPYSAAEVRLRLEQLLHVENPRHPASPRPAAGPEP
ncbi:MAG: response regulator [Acidobacteria bacterium]|nr:response regulator [Acidobacteriota bacterium]